MNSNLPYFLQDHHAQKRFFKALFTWAGILDNIQARDRGNPMNRTENISWRDFHVMAVTMFDLLDEMGFRLYKARGKEDRTGMIDELTELRRAGYAMDDDDLTPINKDEYIDKRLKPYIDGGYLAYLPAWMKQWYFENRQDVIAPTKLTIPGWNYMTVAGYDVNVYFRRGSWPSASVGPLRVSSISIGHPDPVYKMEHGGDVVINELDEAAVALVLDKVNYYADNN